jgi:hypothetical protein
MTTYGEAGRREREKEERRRLARGARAALPTGPRRAIGVSLFLRLGEG